MNVAEIEMGAPPARTAPAPEGPPAEPFDRVLARRAAEADHARPSRDPEHAARDAARTDDGPADAEAPSTPVDRDGTDAAATDADTTDSAETANAAPDADDGKEAKAATVGPGAVCAPTDGAPAKADAEGDASAAVTAKGKAAPATPADAAKSPATPPPAKTAATPATPAAETAKPQAPAPGASGTPSTDGPAEPAAPATTTATVARPDASADGGDTPADGDEGRPGPHKLTAKAHADSKAGDAAPSAPTPDRPADTGLARAMQQAAAPAQAALTRAAEATARASHDGDAHAAGPDKADALGSTSSTSDAAPRVTGDLRAARADGVRHAPAFDQVMDHTLRMVRVGRHEARLRLEPDHLGEVRVRISVDRGHVVADLTVHSHAARDLLEGQQARLQQALVDGGADGARVNVSLGGDQGRDAPDEDPGPREAEISTPVPEAPDAAVRTAAAGPGGLSIRA